MAFFQLCIYIGVFLWMLSPDPIRILCASKQGRRVLYLGAALVSGGYLLSMTCQMFLLMILGSFRIPKAVIFFLYSAVFVVFWLLSAELFHRMYYKRSIQKALTKKKSLVVWLLIAVLATLAYAVYNLIGGMAMTYSMTKPEPGLMRLLLRFCNLLFQIRFPEIFLAVCNSVLYYRTMKYLIFAVERG